MYIQDISCAEERDVLFLIKCWIQFIASIVREMFPPFEKNNEWNSHSGTWFVRVPSVLIVFNFLRSNAPIPNDRRIEMLAKETVAVAAVSSAAENY